MSYTRQFVRDNKFVTETVTERIDPIYELSGKGIIVEVGGNGRFKFLIGDELYTTTFVDKVCSCGGDYFTYYDVEFDIDIKQEWSRLYSKDCSDNYWKVVN